MEDTIRLFRNQLFETFWEWVETNKEAIGEKWYAFFQKKGKDAEAECDTALKIMATSLWMFNMISNCGIMAGIGPNNVSIHQLDEHLDEKTSKRLLYIISSCMCLQYLPKEVVMQPIPIISSKRFSLKLWTEQHQ